MSFPINLDGISVGAGWEHPDFVGAGSPGYILEERNPDNPPQPNIH